MSYVGLWKLHSIGVNNEDFEITYMSAEEYLNSPMPSYVDKNDEEAVEEELNDRRKTVSVMLKVGEDGLIYNLMPLPAGVTQEEIDAAVSAGQVNLVDGMMVGQTMPWEERNGELWYNTGDEIEVMGEKRESWFKGSDENGYLNMMTLRFAKAE